ncbi:MAG: fumarylacetoacetate hydrolase family protein [Pseudomonadota bacterium]
MKLRRVRSNQADHIQIENHAGWINLDRIENLVSFLGRELNSASSDDVLAILALDVATLAQLQSMIDQLTPKADETVQPILPIAPASFRDFMLYEKHVIDASRGYTRRFMPGAYRITQVVEKVTGRPFRKFRPHPLWYQQPIYYLSNHLNFGVCGDEIAWPSYSQALDYELEIGAVITKPLFNATAEEAIAAIGGFVVLNDVSARDIQKQEMDSGFGPQKAKHFFSTMSSTVVTADEILPYLDDLNASVAINGVDVARCHSSGMQFSFGDAVAFASKDEQLHPGEFFGSGTLPGGGGMENGHWLKPGDTVTLKIDRIGELSNRIQSRGTV